MSIQNRLLLVYALIFCVVYFLSSLVVYTLPRDQILAQIDADLYLSLIHISEPTRPY